ncbi:nucleoside 2-deoxyribosyltransferase domain-containing protein [Deinococcus sp. QL22]|uniref:nucleoside 2-deoxyribosyltransferase domain-containing protein n=1 Tax=Deinococcus sp. QL22 TaxID=2939437 RepID=UPI002017CC5C|nr:nucleoside 2-deoxyribosyltransferase domain-containing protein [Deinococcus sp. QL22]UQN10311.1 nucleoside 2-deoxyribosyltransferase domain-containing protein [Deinococcus sp. QL22]UQN10445.1 nucleoside 2-deoxyribosyltransferase domain-containing protein [Deinococcus sp. QL22]
MSRPSAYLAGPIAGCSYAGATDWRLAAQSDLARLGITAYSPLRCKTHLSGVAVLDSGHNPEHPLCSPQAIFARDRFDVERVDALFVNLLGATHVSIGTVMEIAWAHVWRKPVVVVMEPSGNVHDGHAMLMQCWGFRAETVETGLELLAAILLPDAQRESEPIEPAPALPELVEPAQRYAERNGVMLPVLVVTPQEFKALLEYSHTIPTGKVIGKRWKAYQRKYKNDPAEVADLNNWAIGEYTRESETHPGMIDMTWYAPEYSAEASA